MRRTRIVELDAIRAIAVISMVIGHVANYSFLWRATHYAYYVWDGAQLFMLVSGIVVGVVQHRAHGRHGMRYVSVRLLRRAALLYVVQVALVALAIVAYFKAPSDYTSQFKPKFASTFGQAMRDNLLLGVNPIYVNFLSVYVVLLVLTIPGIVLLARGRWLVFSTLVVAVYLASQAWPGWFTLPVGPEAGNTLNFGAWSLLFGSGLLAGWFWHERNIGDWLMRRPVVIVVMSLWLVLLATATVDALHPAWLTQANAWFVKETMAPGRFIASWVFFIVLWWIAQLTAKTAWGPKVMMPLAILGSRSLDSVVILTLAAIAIPTVLHISSQSRAAEILSLVVLAVCWVWAYLRNHQKQRV